ncbi:MAG: ribosome biogenesis GTPase Der [Pseudomonadales bacterium]
MLPVIALVGRPNVGKSTLFNRLTRTRDALVAGVPGLTRDRQFGKAQVDDQAFWLVDTGGLSGLEEGIDEQMAAQSLTAIDEANFVFFLVDVKDGFVPQDDDIAKLLRSKNKPVQLVANKIDGQNTDLVRGEFARLGFGEPALISASNGHGIKRLIAEFFDRLGSENHDEHSDSVEPAPGSHLAQEVSNASGIKIAVVGRPNVGKSTLVNRILGEQRVVVFDQAGTTRDSIYIPFERDGDAYTLIDTAGVRRRGRINESIEKFSVIKTLDAIQDAHVVLLLIDAHEGLVEQDLHLLGHAMEAGRALVICINKWDGTSQEQKDRIHVELDRRLTFLDFAQIHYISALHGSGVGQLFGSVKEAYASATKPLSTSHLNNVLNQAVTEHQPPMVHGRRIKLRFAHAGGSNPPRIIIHGNQTEAVPDSYRRYLEKRFHEALGLKGTPLQIEFRTQDNPFKGRKNKLTERQVNRRRRMMAHVKKTQRSAKHKKR